MANFAYLFFLHKLRSRTFCETNFQADRWLLLANACSCKLKKQLVQDQKGTLKGHKKTLAIIWWKEESFHYFWQIILSVEPDIFKTLVGVWRAPPGNKSRPTKLWFCAVLLFATEFCSPSTVSYKCASAWSPDACSHRTWCYGFMVSWVVADSRTCGHQSLWGVMLELGACGLGLEAVRTLVSVPRVGELSPGAVWEAVWLPRCFGQCPSQEGIVLHVKLMGDTHAVCDGWQWNTKWWSKFPLIP